MTLIDSIRLSVSALRGSTMRTLLTILSLAIGVAAVLTVLSLGDAGESRVEDEITRLGVNRVWIRPADEGTTILAGDAATIRAAVQSPACAGSYALAEAVVGRKAVLTQVAGFDDFALEVHSPQAIAGRLMNRKEFSGEGSICLIDEVLNDSFDIPLLGEYIRILNRRFRVVGVIKAMSKQTHTGSKGMIVLPLTTVMDTFDSPIAEITISVQQGRDASEIATKASAALLHGNFRTDTMEKEIDAAREIVRVFVTVLFCVAIVSMIAGGIGVMNIMLVSVRERRNEIGLIKAIGGTKRQIAILFIFEAAAYAAIGSVFGILLGQGMIVIFSRLIGLDAGIRSADIIIVLLSAAVLGISFGVSPALKAAALEPIEALDNQ